MSWLGKLVKGTMVFLPTYCAFTDIFYAVRTVEGISMQPTLNPDGKSVDFVLLDRWAAAVHRYERGEVVSLVSPKDPTQWLIKRVVALEGDEIKTAGCFEESVKIPRGHCWVEGDNRLSSLDSNNFGPVSLGLITAKATRVLWPPKRWGEIETKALGPDRVTERENVESGRMFFGWE